MSERDIMHKVQIKASGRGWRLFRNNCGVAWVGKPVRVKGTTNVILQNARRIRFGLCTGSADLIGWKPVIVTPDMVGHTIAQFVAREIKTLRGSPTTEQLDFILAVIDAGGDGLIVNSDEEFQL